MLWRTRRKTTKRKRRKKKLLLRKKRKPNETVEDEDDVKPEVSKAKRKRIKIGAAAKKADASVPDQFADMSMWSDED